MVWPIRCMKILARQGGSTSDNGVHRIEINDYLQRVNYLDASKCRLRLDSVANDRKLISTTTCKNYGLLLVFRPDGKSFHCNRVLNSLYSICVWP